MNIVFIVREREIKHLPDTPEDLCHLRHACLQREKYTNDLGQL